MLINDELQKQNMTKYRLSKDSGVPQDTINDSCSGKAEIEKCAAGTQYRLAQALGLTVEDILKSAKDDDREDFETFKSNTCHHVKDMGDILLQFQRTYPGLTNTDNVNDILHEIHRRKEDT